MTWVKDPSTMKIGDKGKVRLTQEDRTTERVWYEVVEILEDGKFRVKLLNQPFNIDLDWGDIIEIVDNDPEKVPEYILK